MTGHEPILEMRRRGKAPVTVWLTDEPEAPRTGTTVYIAPHERPELLDLRFLVGLTVLVDGDTDARVDSLVAACVQARAKRVIGNTFDGPWMVRITDTDGAFTRQK